MVDRNIATALSPHPPSVREAETRIAPPQYQDTQTHTFSPSHRHALCIHTRDKTHVTKTLSHLLTQREKKGERTVLRPSKGLNPPRRQYMMVPTAHTSAFSL